MQKDLFGNDVDDRDSFEKELQEFDEATFGFRLSRFRYFYKYFPQYETIMFGSDESYRIFHEVKNCFINGEYIAVLILSQSFIERRFQESLKISGLEKESNYTFSKILKNLAGNGTIPEYFLDKVDAMRLKRNPFVHLKEVMEKNNLYSRSSKIDKDANDVLQKDAEEAISLMFESLKIRVL